MMAKMVLKNDQNQAFWGDMHSKLGYKKPKIRKIGNIGHLKPILTQLRGTFDHK
jgi:hypothetical protein